MKYIQNIISEGEHQRQDFKFAVNDFRKIARTLVAFSNTNGGKLLIGVKDNGKIAGIRSEEEIHMLEGAATVYSRPHIDLSFQTWAIEGKTILEVDLLEGKEKPYYVKEEGNKWKAWFRQEDENHPANQVLLNYWKNKNMDTGVLLKYSKSEEFLLSYLQEFERISLEEFRKLTATSQSKAVAIFSKLMTLEQLSMRFEEGSYYYYNKNRNDFYAE